MRLRTLILSVLTLAGCPGGDGLIGDHCSDENQCHSELQCLHGTCLSRCVRAPECGDGYSCDASGYCIQATGQDGDSCATEVDCAAGLACEIEAAATVDTGNLVASCVPENAGHPAGATCGKDGDCRNGTCQPCGGLTQRCCPAQNGDFCGAPYVCATNNTRCVACGANGQPCCAGDTCSAGTCNRNSGMCQP